MTRTRLATLTMALAVVNVALWSCLSVGVIALDLEAGSLFHRSVAMSARRCREEGIRVEYPMPSVEAEIRGMYGSGFEASPVYAGTLAEFIEAARNPGVVYATPSGLVAVSWRGLLVYSPVIRGRLWPYTVEWVNQ